MITNKKCDCILDVISTAKLYKQYFPTYWKQVSALLILTPILTELLTNNITAWKLFQPKLFFLFAVWVYGPVLLLRELAVRWRVGLAGHIMLGLAYGLYNEGLVSKTIFQAQVPNPAFNNYGMVWGINLTWTFVIIIFHAFYAFLFPLLIVYNIFPKAATKPWIAKKWWLAISLAFLTYTSYTFLKHGQKPEMLVHFFLLLISTTILVLLSRVFTKGGMFVPAKPGAWLPLAYGIVFVAAIFFLSNLIALTQVHYSIFLLYMLISLCGISLLLHKKFNIHALLIFCLTSQVAFSGICLWVAILTSSRPGIYTSSVFAAVFIVAISTILFRRRKYKPFGMKAV